MPGNQEKQARKGGKKRGRPSEYRGQYCTEAEKLLALGATMEQIADFFDVSVSAVKRWAEKHKEFRTALRVGRIRADAEVADSLYRRACGYRHKALKIFCSEKGGVTKVPYNEVYPPDTAACKFWLTNRRPHQWREKVVVEQTKGGLAERLKAARKRVGENNGGEVPKA